MALDDVQWPCIECRINEEHFKAYKAELESRLLQYKRKCILSHNLIEKYKEKCNECENLYQQQEKCVGMLANYKWRMGCALRTTFPMRSTLKETRDELVSVRSQLLSESEARKATHQHSTQLQNCISDREEKIARLEKELEESKGNARSLQRQLMTLNQTKLNLKNKRKCLKLVGRKGVPVEASVVYNKSRQDLDPNVSEDEGIFSLDRSSICSSIDSQSNSVGDVCIDGGVFHSPEMLPEGHLGVHSTDTPEQLHSKKEKEIKDSSIHKEVITDLDISLDKDESMSEMQNQNKQNSAEVNNSWSLHSNLETEGKRHENQTSTFELADQEQCQTNKILPLLDPSTKLSHSSAAGEHSLQNHTEQQKSLPLLTVQNTESGVSEIPSFPSMLAENQNNTPLNRHQIQNQSETCKAMSSINFIRKHHERKGDFEKADKSKEGFEKANTKKLDYMVVENTLQTDQDISAEKHSFSLQSNSSLSDNSTLEENEILPHVGISSPECENPSQSNTVLKAALKNQEQHALKQQKNRSIFDAVEMEDSCTFQSNLKSCPSRLEIVNETDTAIHEKLKKPEALSTVEHEDKKCMNDSFCHLSADDFTGDLIDSVLQEMAWQCPPLSPMSDLTSVQDEGSSVKASIVSCSIAVGTDHLLCDVGIQTTEECFPRRLIKLTDVVIQTERMGCNRETQTCSGDQGQHNKNLVPVAVQTEVQETYDLRAQHSSTCNTDNSNTFPETPCRIVCACRKKNTAEACRDPEIRESLNSARLCNLNKEVQCPVHLKDDAKEECCCKTHIKCSSKDMFEQYEKLIGFHQQYLHELHQQCLQLSCKMLQHQSGILPHSQPLLSGHSRTLPISNCNIDHHFKKQYIKTCPQHDSKNAATHHMPSETFGVTNLPTSGDCLYCIKSLENMECSKIDVGSNNSLKKSGTSVQLKHENTDETSEELIYRDTALGNYAHDREENKIELEKRLQDSNSLFGHISDLSSDDDKKSHKLSINDVSLRKRAVESDSEALVEHDLPVKKMRKQRFKNICVTSSDEDDFMTAADAQNNKPAIKTSPCDFRIPTHTEKNKPSDKITRQSCNNSEYREHSSGKPIPSKTVLKAAHTLKKNSKISKLERMRMNIVKAKTKVKIPRASPERRSQRLKKRSVDADVDVKVSSPAMRPKEVKKSCVSQSNAHSLPPASETMGPKISRLLPSHTTDNETIESSQVSIQAVWPREVSKSSDTQSNASVLMATAPIVSSACTEPKMSQLLPGNRTNHESAKSSNARKISESNTHLSDNLFTESSVQKFERNTEESIEQSLSISQLSPPLAEAASLQKVDANEPGDPTDKTEEISNAQNNIGKAEENSEELKKGCCIQWALKLMQKEAEQEGKKETAFRDSSKIQQRVKKALEELESEAFDDEHLAFVVQELAVINKTCVVDFVARGVVKAVVADVTLVDKTHTPPAPPLTVLQQRLMALIFTLHNEHQMFKELPEKILLAIEYKTLRLGCSPNLQRCRKLVCFYSAVCRALKDVKRVQLYCLDALYSLHYKSAPILNTVLCTFPEALPHADKGKDIPLVICLVFLIFTPVQYRKKTNFNIKPLKDLLHQLYGYEPGKFTVDQLLAFFLEKLRNEGDKEVPIALILLAKRMSHEWAYRTLLCKNLIPLVTEWKAAKLQNSAFAAILPIMGYIVRCFPVGESRAFIEKIKYIYTSIMEDENAPAEVQEGAVMGLLSLSRHNPSHIAGLLKNWQPKMKLSNKVLHKIAAFMQYRPLKFWTHYASR